jgi:uncharacterized protein (UPF0262 family)
MSRITHIVLDDANLPPPTPEIEQERKVALFDLLEENVFSLPRRDDRPVPEGPYHLGLSIRDKRLVFDVNTEKDEKAAEFHLSLGPFRQVVKDYFQICESYFEAVKKSRVLQERLEGKAEIDTDTARRLFTLICVLHYGG